MCAQRNPCSTQTNRRIVGWEKRAIKTAMRPSEKGTKVVKIERIKVLK